MILENGKLKQQEVAENQEYADLCYLLKISFYENNAMQTNDLDYLISTFADNPNDYASQQFIKMLKQQIEPPEELIIDPEDLLTLFDADRLKIYLALKEKKLI